MPALRCPGLVLTTVTHFWHFLGPVPDQCRTRAGSQFGPVWVPVWSQFGPSLVPVWFQFGTSLVPFLVHFDPILVSFWFHFASSLVRVCSQFGVNLVLEFLLNPPSRILPECFPRLLPESSFQESPRIISDSSSQNPRRMLNRLE